MTINAELLKRAFGAFDDVAKAGVLEVDLSKVAKGIAKDAFSVATGGDLAKLEKRAEEIEGFLSQVEIDDAGRAYSPATELARTFKALPPNMDDYQYSVAHGSGRAKPPTGAGAKANMYTAGSGIANRAEAEQDDNSYTRSSTQSVGTAPGGKDGTSFDQPASTSEATKARADGAPGSVLAENQEEQGDLVSSGLGKAKTEKAPPAPEDDSDEAPTDEADDRSAAEAKDEEKAKKATADGPDQSVDDLDEDEREPRASGQTKPNASEDDAGEVDEVSAKVKKAAAGSATPDPEEEVDEPADEDAASKKNGATCKKAPPFKGAAKPFGSDDEDDGAKDEEKSAKKAAGKAKADPDQDGDDDSDGHDETEEKAETKKAEGDDEWPSDLAPAVTPYTKSERLTSAEVPIPAREGASKLAKAVGAVRRASFDGKPLTPDQRRRERVRALRESGYSQGQGSAFFAD